VSEASGTLSPQEARRVYDRMGRWLDTQAFYEDPATRDLVRHARFEAAEAVFEFGCGTGRFARLLLSRHLPPDARYRAWDVSPRMVGLARARLAAFAERAEVVLSEGGPPLSEPADSCDRFVSNYVLDLLSESDIRAVVGEARRMLRPGGLLCLASLSAPHGPFSRLLIAAWSALHARSPRLTGGCRPIDLLSFVSEGEWKLRHHGAFTPLGIPSESVVAERT
jgi:ubiquinone/menaquinone biosynthesis C-methylase UbiE